MYKLTASGVRRLSDNVDIPNNSANKDWRKYQKWLDEGNTPEPKETEEEKEINKGRRIKALEIAIVDMRVRGDGASAEGLTDLETESDAELVSLRAELAAEIAE